jgi:rod shape determining protein RodA
LLPIAGIPLPFVSAGGSSLISFFAALSLCMSVRMRRYVN